MDEIKMSIDEYYSHLGVKHTGNDCEICNLNKLMASERHTSLLSRLWHSAIFVWCLVIIALVAAWFALIWGFYMLVAWLV
jgi:hypothetical protein